MTKAEAFYAKPSHFKDEMNALRKFMLDAGLEEDFKWGKPCYTLNAGNVGMVVPFKEYVSIMLMKGALVKDPEGMLVKAGENTQSAMQLRFTSLKEINGKKTLIKQLIKDAAEVERAGLKVKLKKIEEVPVPSELSAKFKSMPAFGKAFKSLTPGRQRAYIIHIAGAKQEATRVSRVEKIVPNVLAGKGMNE